MSSSPSLSSSTSKPLVSYSFQEANPMPLMENLLSVTARSDAAIQKEVLKTSLAVSRFIELMTEQFQGMAQRMAELEYNVITARAQSQEAKKMHEAQMRAIELLTQTVMSLNEKVGALKSQVSLIESSVGTTQIVISALEKRFNTHSHAYSDSWIGYYPPGFQLLNKNTGGPST